MFVLNMGQIKRKICQTEAFRHKIREYSLLDIPSLFGAFKRVAFNHKLWRIDLEHLVCCSALCEFNVSRLGEGVCNQSEVRLLMQVRRVDTTKSMNRLLSSGFLLSHGRSVLWPWQPCAYSVTADGKRLIKAIHEEIAEQQKRLNTFHITKRER